MIPKDRKDQSRELLVKAFYMSLGSYTEQEAKKNDSWRDQSLGDLFNHLSHEIEEIKQNIRTKTQIHAREFKKFKRNPKQS